MSRPVTRTIHDLAKALAGSRAPSRRSIEQQIASGDVSGIMQTLSRYAKGGSAMADPTLQGWISRAMSLLGLRGLKGRSRRRSNDPLTQAAQAITALVEQPQRIGNGGKRPPRGPGVSAPAPGPQPAPPPGWAGGGFSGRFPGSTLDYGAEPPLPGQQSPYGEEILTPQSSNVFSFSYIRLPGQATGTLYVTFKAAALNTKSLSSGHVRRGRGLSRRQLKGTLGSTVSGKTNERGPMYAYLRVPPAVFSRLKAAHSKGKAVWDNLRIRGTVYGHRFQYVLVQGSVTIQQGVSGVYVPRKATQQGFKSRSVRDIGSKTFQTSTLPSQRGFATRTRPRR